MRFYGDTTASKGVKCRLAEIEFTGYRIRNGNGGTSACPIVTSINDGAGEAASMTFT
jgi:hypothetical protein